MYGKYIKRGLDLLMSIVLLFLFWWLLAIISLIIICTDGTPVVFKQERPGLNGEIFTLHKFRTMTDKRDENGDFLSDEERLTSFGKLLRSLSLDELLELWDIFT